MTTIKLTKMQGCGNDFVIIDYPEYKKTGMTMPDLAQKVCDRHFGVGADGMFIPKLNTENTDIGWYFYNNDGSTAQMCGNGMRCFAKYAHDNKLINKKKFTVKTLAGIITPEILDDGNVKVDMGCPILEDEKIPFKGDRKIKVSDNEFNITPVSMGNPHCVIFVEGNTMDYAVKYGPEIEKHPYFPEKTNTEFVRIISKNEVEMSVFERGCGITLACGTGACATLVASVLNNLTESKIKVNLPGGAVTVEWQGNKTNLSTHIFMTGPANYTFVADYIL
jgi:diaminopimelate epimerase